MVITLPFVLLLLDFWPLGRIEGWTKPSAVLSISQRSFASLVLEKLPLLPFCIASAVVTFFAQVSSGAEKMISVSRAARLENALSSYAMYFWKALWPSGLAPFYPHPSTSLGLWRLILAGCFLILISATVWKLRLKQGYLFTGWLWYLGTLVPVIGIIQVGMQARADRYAYIPLIGIFLMLVWAFADFADSRKVNPTYRAAAALAMLAALSVLAWRQDSFWASSYDLWTHTLSVTTDNSVAEHNMGTELMRLGRTVDAVPYMIRATELNPADMVSMVNLGAALSATGHHREAIQKFECVLQQSNDPRLLLPAYQDLSNEYRQLGDLAKAEENQRQFLRIQESQQIPDGVAMQVGKR
jgi:tetratricopeptide (TPR) repeat protein